MCVFMDHVTDFKHLFYSSFITFIFIDNPTKMSQISQNARTEKNVLYKYLALEQPKDKVTVRYTRFGNMYTL